MIFKVSPDKRYENTIEMTGSSGYIVSSRNERAFNKVSFPFQGKVTFRVSGAKFIVTERCIVDFTINKPGGWNVIIDQEAGDSNTNGSFF